MSGLRENPIFFNKKKNKDWTSRATVNTPPPTSNNIPLLSYPPTPLDMDVLCVTPLISNAIFEYS